MLAFFLMRHNLQIFNHKKYGNQVPQAIYFAKPPMKNDFNFRFTFELNFLMSVWHEISFR